MISWAMPHSPHAHAHAEPGRAGPGRVRVPTARARDLQNPAIFLF